MANICCTNYCLTGPLVELRALYNIMKKCETQAPVDTSFVHLAKELGNNEDEFDLNGEWGSVFASTVKGEHQLRFTVNSRWERCEDFTKLISMTFPSIAVWFITEEPGNNIYETNDSLKKYFPEQIRIVAPLGDAEFHYVNKKDATKLISEMLGRNIPDYESAKRLVELHNDFAKEEESGDEIIIREADIV